MGQSERSLFVRSAAVALKTKKNRTEQSALLFIIPVLRPQAHMAFLRPLPKLLSSDAFLHIVAQKLKMSPMRTQNETSQDHVKHEKTC